MSIAFVFFIAVIAQTNTLKESVTRGKKVYDKVCLSCHMADGGGVPKMNPPLIQTSYVLGDKKKIIYIVLHGMNDRIPIEDEYFSNNMAAHADLSDQQIADVLTYVRNSFGNKADAVTVADVKAVRNPVKKK
jgi:mono/diheme cytochrome c family protein